jgi:Ca2+-binding EF-hand superfamily protein
LHKTTKMGEQNEYKSNQIENYRKIFNIFSQENSGEIDINDMEEILI